MLSCQSQTKNQSPPSAMTVPNTDPIHIVLLAFPIPRQQDIKVLNRPHRTRL